MARRKRARGRRLRDIVIDEVSLVDKAANMLTFAFVKNADPDDPPPGFVEVFDDEEEISPEQLGADLAQAAVEGIAEALDPTEEVTPAQLGHDLGVAMAEVLGE